MGREIKFRAWDSKKKEMHPCSSPWMGSVMALVEGTDKLVFEAFSEENIVVMQFTGLKDKNGREIYEGDFLALIQPKKIGKQTEFGIVEVKFGEYSDAELEYGSSGIGWYVVGFNGYIRKNGVNFIYPIGGVASEQSLNCVLQWEVIGNIYENHELLKENKSGS